MATSYKFGGSKVPGMEVNRLITEGSSTNPKQTIELGETVELSDEDVERYRKSGLKFTKTDGDSESNDNSGDEGGTPETPAEQQEAQAATAPVGAQPTIGRTSGRKQ